MYASAERQFSFARGNVQPLDIERGAVESDVAVQPGDLRGGVAPGDSGCSLHPQWSVGYSVAFLADHQTHGRGRQMHGEVLLLIAPVQGEVLQVEPPDRHGAGGRCFPAGRLHGAACRQIRRPVGTARHGDRHALERDLFDRYAAASKHRPRKVDASPINREEGFGRVAARAKPQVFDLEQQPRDVEVETAGGCRHAVLSLHERERRAEQQRPEQRREEQEAGQYDRRGQEHQGDDAASRKAVRKHVYFFAYYQSTAFAGSPFTTSMHRSSIALGLLAAALTAAAPAPALAQSRPAETSLADSGIDPGLIDGPPAPEAPAVMTRDEEGRTTVRAIHLDEGLRLDGVLDEPVYQGAPAITGFIQQLPDYGSPATERTEAWVMFDDTNVYVAARLHESAPESQWVANEMRRDTNQLRQNDTFTAFFDTFYDRRNGFNFYTNPLGARADQQFTNEGNPNGDWNPVWDVRSGRFDGGWTVEMEIPFKTLRYRSEPPHVWGIQLRRAIRRKNEWVYLTRLPESAGGGNGSAGIFRVSAAGTLVGLEPPPASRNIEIKPYAIGGVTTDLTANPAIVDEGSRAAGIDIKYGITQNLTADFTVNTDFAQVEVDERQVNLTRFPLFFPEKREFFLEGSGIFGFARGGVTGRFVGGRGGGDVPQLFYSRKIGLEQGRVVPIVGGARVTGKIGRFDVGALNIQAGDEMVSRSDPTNYTVVRLRRDILRRSSIGAIATNRSVSRVAPGSSQAYGIDGTFAFFESVSLVTYVARTRLPSPEYRGKDLSYQGKFEYAADRYGFQADHLVVEDNFHPEVGFRRRGNFRRTFTSARFSPRPRSIDSVRQFVLEGSIDYIVTADENLLETRQNTVSFQTEFESSDSLSFQATDNYEMLFAPFQPTGADFDIPVGGYRFADAEVSYSIGQQRRVNGTMSVKRGQYYGGDLTTVEFRQGRIAVLPQMSVEPTISFNWIDTPYGEFQTNLAVTRVNYAFNPRMFFSGLLQYNSAGNSFGSNLRLRWEYSPGSELFVVYTDDRDVTGGLRPDRGWDLRNRGFVVKFNRLFRF